MITPPPSPEIYYQEHCLVNVTLSTLNRDILPGTLSGKCVNYTLTRDILPGTVSGKCNILHPHLRYTTRNNVW